MFIGENPSWEFGQRVPFDGITNSGRALHEHYLLPLKRTYNLIESDFWITDLFKCRYPKEVYREKGSQQDLIFTNSRTCATTWLLKEIRLTRPEVIVTLGDKEVYQRLRTIFGLKCPPKFTEAAYFQLRLADTNANYFQFAIQISHSTIYANPFQVGSGQNYTVPNLSNH